MNMKYISTTAGSYRRLFVFTIGLFATVGFFYVYPFGIYTKYISNHPDEFLSMTIILVIGLSLGIWCLLFYLLPMAREFWTCRFFITIDDDRIIGSNLWKQKQEMQADKIISIKKEKRCFLHGLTRNIVLTDISGNTMCIHSNIEPLGECIKTIRRLAVNVQEVDYGGLDQKPEIWEGKDKM